MRKWRTFFIMTLIAVFAVTTLIAEAGEAGPRRRKRPPKPKPTPTVTATPTPSPTATPTPPPPPPPSAKPRVPTSGALFGAYTDPDARWTDNATAIQEALTFEAQIGRSLAINQHYYSWTNTFPSGLEQDDIARGRIPLVSWDGTTLGNITSGQHNSLITSRANAMKNLNSPVFLRWAWEMNGNWYNWSGTANNTSGATDGPAKYVAAWRYIHGIFQSVGATNVAFVWCPNNDSVPSSSWNNHRNYYPGDAYVDWVCIDGYNWGTSRSWSSWRQFKPLMSAVYNDYAATKPIMIGETSSTETGGNKAAWISQMSADIKASMPAIKALVWFHVNKEEDWRADSTSASMTAYRAVAQDPYFDR